MRNPPLDLPVPSFKVPRLAPPFGLAIWLIAGCTGSGPSTPDEMDTDAGPDTDVPIVDCTALPDAPFLRQTVVTSFDDGRNVVFDDSGGMIGVANSGLYRATSLTDGAVLIPQTDLITTLLRLPGGDFITAGLDLRRIHLDGSSTVLIDNGRTFGGAVMGPDGRVWTADAESIYKVDPLTGDFDVFFTEDGFSNPFLLTFNLDRTRLYVGTIATNDKLVEILVNPDGTAGDVRIVASQAENESIEGLELDACGNLYTLESEAAAMFRYRPENGSREHIFDFSDTPSGMQWGSGIGDWGADVIYVKQYGEDSLELIEIGVPMKDFNGGDYEVVLP